MLGVDNVLSFATHMSLKTATRNLMHEREFKWWGNTLYHMFLMSQQRLLYGHSRGNLCYISGN